MRLPVSNSTGRKTTLAPSATACIGLGLALQIAATWWPIAPVVTALALVALGATSATVSRLANNRAAAPLLLAHLAIYSLLYVVYVGAVWHGAHSGARQGWHFWQWLDVALSFAPMFVSLRLVYVALTGGAGRKDATSR